MYMCIYVYMYSCNLIPMMQPGTSRTGPTSVLRWYAAWPVRSRQDFLDVTRFVIKWPSTQIGPQHLGMGDAWEMNG